MENLDLGMHIDMDRVVEDNDNRPPTLICHVSPFDMNDNMTTTADVGSDIGHDIGHDIDLDVDLDVLEVLTPSFLRRGATVLWVAPDHGDDLDAAIHSICGRNVSVHRSSQSALTLVVDAGGLVTCSRDMGKYTADASDTSSDLDEKRSQHATTKRTATDTATHSMSTPIPRLQQQQRLNPSRKRDREEEEGGEDDVDTSSRSRSSSRSGSGSGCSARSDLFGGIAFVSEEVMRTMLARATEPCNMQGTYGSIRYAFDEDGVRLAVKMQHGAKTASEREVMLESAMNEANAYSLLHRAAGAADELCPEILWLKYVAFMAPSKIALAFEAWPMDLCKLLHQNRDLGLAQRLHLALDVAKGLCHMHSLHPHPLLHGDIKYDNVLVKMEHGRWRACIMDLGLAKVLDPRHTIVRSMHPGDARCSYMPNDAILTPAFDMFSYGMLAACMLLGDFGMYTIKNAVKCIQDRLREKGLRRRLAEQLAPEAVDDLLDMVKRCLHDQPTRRPPAKEVVTTLGVLLTRVSKMASMTPTTPPTRQQRSR